MPAAIQFPSGAHFNGPLSANEFYPPSASVKDAAIAQVVGGEVGYEKLEHLIPLVFKLPIARQTVKSPIFDLTSATNQSNVLLIPQQAIAVREARVVYDVGSTNTVSDGTIQLGTSAAGIDIVAATNYENSKAAGAETALTVADAVLAAGGAIHLTHTAPASGVTGEAHLELDYQVLDLSPIIYIARKAATVVALEAVCETPATGTQTLDIDLKAGNASSAFSSILTAAVQFTNSDAARTVKSGTINTPALAAADQLQLTLATGGATAAQLFGLTVVVWVKTLP